MFKEKFDKSDGLFYGDQITRLNVSIKKSIPSQNKR